MNKLFKFGGGAGIGSYVIVIENGALKPVRAEVVRESYDKGENLYLSIIDDSTEEALLPLSGYVDNEGILHLSGRDFDDNKTYEFTVNNAEQTISVEAKEGVTIGDTTIPTSGGGGGTQLYQHTLVCACGCDEWEDIKDCTFIITNLSNAALRGERPDDWLITGNYISGMLIYPDDEVQRYAPILLITQESEPNCYVLDAWGNSLKFYFTDFAKSEEITPL